MKHRHATISLFVFLAFSIRVWAQDPVGNIEGFIADQSGAPLSNATVTAKNLDTSFTKETLTGQNGLFRIPLLPIGRYSVTASAPNFSSVVQEPIQVNVAQTVRI